MVQCLQGGLPIDLPRIPPVGTDDGGGMPGCSIPPHTTWLRQRGQVTVSLALQGVHP